MSVLEVSPKMFSAVAIANRFIEIAKEHGKTLTNMQLQKLVYIAHGFHLALFEAPLINDPVEAWRYGPVYPPLYSALRMYGAGVVNDTVYDIDEFDGSDVQELLLQRIWDVYGHESGLKLSARTHAEGTPWSQIWNEKEGGEIPNELIQKHYSSLIIPSIDQEQ